MIRRALGLVVLVGLTVVATLAGASPGLFAEEKKEAEKPKPVVALTAEEAGPDFASQGEYDGVVKTPAGDMKLGVQVIALGGGKFRAVSHLGGLPGDGEGKHEKHQADGMLKDGVVTFTGDKGAATLKDGVLTAKTPEGVEIAQLKKIVRKSPTLGAKPPDGAVVLLDGKSADAWTNGKLTDDGLLIQGTSTKQEFQSGTLHLEFLLSFMPQASGQGRANSGCYLQGRYEVQILDSFGLEGKDNECGGIYSVKDPDANMCFPPLSWQTYDIDFTAAKFDESGKKTANARMTVRHNGVVVHNDVEVPKTTTAAPKQEGAGPGPIYLQDHGNPIRFRNAWFVAK